MKKYRVFDHDIGDYVSPYDEDKDYWTLDEARDLAYRKQEDWCAEEEPEYRQHAYEYLVEIGRMTKAEDIAEALSVFNYELEEM